MKQTHCHRLSPKRSNAAEGTVDCDASQSLQRFAVEGHPLAHANASPSRDERFRSPRLQGVDLWTRLPPDLEEVLETACGEEHDASTLPFQDRIRSDGGRVADVSAKVLG
jgi:hypothetical protein